MPVLGTALLFTCAWGTTPGARQEEQMDKDEEEEEEEEGEEEDDEHPRLERLRAGAKRGDPAERFTHDRTFTPYPLPHIRSISLAIPHLYDHV